ncbi:hypothetical protein RhiirB3_434499 [Rhizophagus irregularis]|nr:hypothetical protein RhiirB3_434499 [Rhizophagus irregularis]
MDFVSMSEEDADYAIKIMNQIKLYGKPIRATSDKKNLDVGVSLFIRNLDPGIGEKMLYDTFSAFGVICQQNLMKFNLDENPDKTAMDRSTTPKGKGERHGSAAGSNFFRIEYVRPPTVPPPMIVASGVFLFDMLFIKKTEYSKITIRSGGLLKNEKELRFVKLRDLLSLFLSEFSSALKSTDSHFLDRIGSASLNFLDPG